MVSSKQCLCCSIAFFIFSLTKNHKKLTKFKLFTLKLKNKQMETAVMRKQNISQQHFHTAPLDVPERFPIDLCSRFFRHLVCLILYLIAFSLAFSSNKPRKDGVQGAESAKGYGATYCILLKWQWSYYVKVKSGKHLTLQSTCIEDELLYSFFAKFMIMILLCNGSKDFEK